MLRGTVRVGESFGAEIVVAQPAQFVVAAPPVAAEPVAAETVALPVRRPWTGKVVAALFSVAVLGAMLSAVVQNWQAQPRDSFPLSYFPMFTIQREDLHTEHYVVGWDARGNRWTIPFNDIAPGGSLVRIRADTVFTMVKRDQSVQLCQDVGRRIVERNRAALRPLVRLDVVTGTYSLSEYLRGQKAPKSEVVRATCTIERRAA